jgi:hypothetical protein
MVPGVSAAFAVDIIIARRARTNRRASAPGSAAAPRSRPRGAEKARDLREAGRADESSASVGDARFAKINAHPIGSASELLSAHPCIGDGVVARATRQVQKEFMPTAPVVDAPFEMMFSPGS